MERFLSTWAASAVALAFSAWLLGTHMAIGSPGEALSEQLITLAAVSLVFTLISSIIGPIIKLLSLPFIIVTLGFALLIINALLLQLTESVSDALGFVFVIDGFGWAMLASVVISISQSVVLAFFGED